MRRTLKGALLAAAACLLPAGAAPAEEADQISTWTAPPYWTSPSDAGRETHGREPLASGRQPLAIGPVVMPFVAVTPCRVADTRSGSGFSGGYGPPSLASSETRSYTIVGQCGIPADAQAVSFNFTVWGTASYGNLTVYPAGAAVPTVSTLNWPPGTLALANAAIVPLGTGGNAGKISVANQSTSAVDVFIDINGYYTPLGIVNSVNTLTGAVTLAQGSNVTITPSGNTLTIAAAGGGGVTSVAGTNGISASPSTGAVTVTSNATSSNSAFTIVARDAGGNFTTNSISLVNNINLPATTSGFAGSIGIGGSAFLHALGSRNTFVGTSAGNASMTVANATDNTGVGFSSLFRVTTGAYNSAFGAGALAFNTSGAGNSAFGQNALDSNDVGGGNSAFGRGALAFNTNGNGNQAFGASALQNNTSGSANAAFGQFALQNNVTGGNNTAFGNSALQNNSVSNSSAFGTSALRFNSTGVDNSAFGFNALTSNTTGNANSAFGKEALMNSNAGSNAAFGSTALKSTTTGCCNAAFGTNAMQTNVSGAFNTAIGGAALFASTGSSNTALGASALNNLTGGDGNIGIGYFAGTGLGSGSNNIYIGADTPGNESSVIRIGSIQTATVIAGIYGAAIGGSGLAVSVNSSGRLGTTSSSRRYKEEIVDIADESDVLMKLRPVAYFYKPELDPTHTRQYGLIAEEVAELAPGLVATDRDGRIETVRYPLVNAMLLNEVQKSRRMIDELRAERDTLVQRLDAIEKRLSRSTGRN